MIDYENNDMCELCFSNDDVIRTKLCKHMVCLKCLSVNDCQYCPLSSCRTKLHPIDIHRKKIYVRSGEILGRKKLFDRY